jgi:hypothetical protein
MSISYLHARRLLSMAMERGACEAKSVVDASMLILSVLFGVGSVVMFVLLQSVHYLQMGWPDSYVLPWDALLSLAFFVQHSGMVRRSFRKWSERWIPGYLHGAVYTFASAAASCCSACFGSRRT